MHEDAHFEWDEQKDIYNQKVHGISFDQAKTVFDDPYMIIVRDKKHSLVEERFYCVGKVLSGILMVRFTVRGSKVRIFGAGYWRQGRKIYEKANKIYKHA